MKLRIFCFFSSRSTARLHSCSRRRHVFDAVAMATRRASAGLDRDEVRAAARQARAQAYVVDRTMTSIKVNPATMEATMYYAC